MVHDVEDITADACDSAVYKSLNMKDVKKTHFF